MTNRSNPAMSLCAMAAIYILATSGNAAHAGGFFLASEFGISDADFEDISFSDGDAISDSADETVISASLLAGYEWRNNVFFETGYQNFGNLSAAFLSDALSVTALRAAVGVYPQSDSKFRFFGKAGLNFWELEARESFFLNPGPEEESSRDGVDLFAQAGVEYRFGDRFRTGLSVSYSDFDVGSATFFSLTLKVFPWRGP